MKLSRNSQATIKQQYECLAAFENVKNSPRITTIYSKRKLRDKLSMFNVIKKVYFCQCFSLLLVNDLKLIFLSPPSNKKSLPTPLHIFFHCLSLLFVKYFKLDFSPATKKASHAPVRCKENSYYTTPIFKDTMEAYFHYRHMLFQTSILRRLFYLF